MSETKNKSTKWVIGAVAIVAVVALILGIIGLVNHSDTKANAIPTINQQVDNIKDTLPELEAVSTELGGYIDTLETTVETLQKDLKTTNTAIDTLETEVYGKVDTEKTAVLNKLKADKTELEAAIAAVKMVMEKGDAALTTAIQDLSKEHAALITTNANDIDALEKTAADLQTQMDDTNTKIDNIKTELEGKISDSEKKVLGELNTLKEDIEDKLTTVNNEIAALKDKDIELDGKITDLRAYVDTQDTAIKNWANGTFSTLEQYNATQTTISEIKGLIDGINTEIAGIKADVKTQVENINKSIADLDAELATEVEKVTKGYEDAVAKAEEDITAAYTEAIATAITASENHMKGWVNTTVAEGYYNKAEIEGEIAALEAKISSGDTTLQGNIDKLKADLEGADAALEEAYKLAITEAIEKFDGEITKEIDDKIAAAKTELQAQIDAINTEITNIKSRLDTLETDVAALKAQIQSVTFVPLYTDGAVKMAEGSDGSRYAFFDFRVSPMAAAEALTVDDLLMEAIYTTDAAQRGDNKGTVTTESLPVLEVSGNKETGIVTIKVSGANLSEDFYNGKVSASAVLTIKTGATEIVSDYVPMVAHSQVWTNIVSVQDWITATLQGGEAEEQIN